MGLEQDIQQTGFRCEHHKATINILFTANWLLERIKQLIEQEDITHQQYNILRILRGSHTPLSTLQIRSRMLDKMSDTSRIVERLLLKQLVHKQTCPHDKRLVDVTISEKGITLLERLDQKNAVMDKITAGLSENEAAMLNDILDKIRGNG